MADDIGPGDWLVCVRSWESSDGGIKAGNLYQVSKIIVLDASFCTACGTIFQPGRGVDLVGLPTLNAGAAWCLCCFKKGGYRPTAAIERLLKEPRKLKVLHID